MGADLITQSELRSEIIARMRLQLEGPRYGPAEFLSRGFAPQSIYSLGVLYPRVEAETEGFIGADLIEEDLGSQVVSDEEPDDAPLAPMLQRRPASVGLSFAVSDSTVVNMEIRGARYVRALEGDLEGWRRKQLAPESCAVSASTFRTVDGKRVLEGSGVVRLRWRRVRGCDVVTITLLNSSAPVDADAQPDPESCLFQVGINVKITQGAFRPTPSPAFVVDPEEEELRLRYRKRCAWAAGHGCSVQWSSVEGEPPAAIGTDFLPVTFVPRFLPEAREGARYDVGVLSIERLSSVRTRDELRQTLSPFVEDFGAWLSNLRGSFYQGHESAAERILGGLEVQLVRMRSGLDVLCSTDEAFEAFILASRALLDQMECIARSRSQPFDRRDARWRPFQLAFQLLAIPGIVSSDDDSGREIVDLIWFPTGGGKTEAYLFLSAFVIVYRRLVDPVRGSGTAVISRYTLRLLTQDQFTRSAALICCLELLRRSGAVPGGDPIRIGLWIGGGRQAAPNSYREACDFAERVLQSPEPVNPFLLECCPHCGTRLVPERLVEDRKSYGFDASDAHFLLRCPSQNCHFKDKLPVQIVDQALYDDPPSLLLGTIDKFARMPWDHRCRSFFGFAMTGSGTRAPDLVIQDELHLVSGPLGSIAALYEAAMDALLEQAGQRPKYIAATATIRGASDQVRRLYGRKVCIFPAPSTDASDSYFMREDNGIARARAYVGFLGQGHTPVTCLVHVAAAVLQAAGNVSTGDDYWTLVAYHNSRRELGKMMTLARDDIPARIEVIASPEVPRRPNEVVELSSSVGTELLPQVLSQMRQPRSDPSAIDVVACTNMISVGVDVERLNLMLVNGQPKTTAEYIQATSRVGRGERSAGLVVVNLAGTKPRDRAHYESFVAFHESYYRWVEPTSVTPESPGACDRALHAAVIAACRLPALPQDSDAPCFDPNAPAQARAIDCLARRLQRGCAEALWPEVESRLEEVIRWWVEAKVHGKVLRYEAKGGQQFKGLLKRYGSSAGAPARETLDSMRNVEGDAAFRIRGAS